MPKGKKKPESGFRTASDGRLRRTRRRLSPGLGIRSRDASELSGYSHNGIASAAKRGAFARLPDGTYDTIEFETWIRRQRDSRFKVPPGKRGTYFEDVPPCGMDLDGADDDSGSLASVRARVITERIRFTLHRLDKERHRYSPLAMYESGMDSVLEIFEKETTWVPQALAPELLGISDDYEIYRLVSDHMKRVAHRIGERFAADYEPELRRQAGTNADLVALQQSVQDAWTADPSERLAALRSIDGLAQVKRLEQQMDIDRRVLVPHVPTNKRLTDVLVTAQQQLMRLGGVVAPSLTDLDDTGVVARRLERAVADVVGQLRHRLNQLKADMRGPDGELAYDGES